MDEFCVSSVSFSNAISYALAQLPLSHISLKNEQRLAIRAVYEGQDVFVCLPTGYGKSLCYQTIPFVMGFKNDCNNTAVVVVSPLIALMEDQVCGLKKKGVKASIITASRSVRKENITTINGMDEDRLFFCAPEALVMSKWRAAFEQSRFSDRIVAIVVDEAHCVSKW